MNLALRGGSGWHNGYVASRFGALGVCMSPAVGELMAELIDTKKVPLRARRMFDRIAPVALDRMSASAIGATTGNSVSS